MSVGDYQKEKSNLPKKYPSVSFAAGLLLISFLLFRIVLLHHSAHGIPQIMAAQGTASWYKPISASSHPKYTCASRDYPKGAVVAVTNLKNHRQVVCEVIEYGPSAKFGRIIDLSEEAFKEIADITDGKIQVSVRKIN